MITIIYNQTGQMSKENDLQPSPNNLHPTSQTLKQEKRPQQGQFEKNYPKNIFIPLLQYLADLGYKEAYESCVGGRSEVEGRNVVSLGTIYALISQGWFVRNVNRERALSHISNKILLNSKIKKKLFHLLMANLILSSFFTDVKDFKRRVSREANTISKKNTPNEEVFAYPNAIIYLLHLFLKILLFHANKKGFNKLEEELEKLSLEEAEQPDIKAKATGSKEEYKFYVKEIVHIFGGKGISVQNYAEVLEEVRQNVMEKDKQLRERYRLAQGIPNWVCFVECVVIRCFEQKKKDIKLTNFIFNEWIGDCRNKMLSIDSPAISHPQDEKNNLKEQKNIKDKQSMEWINNKLNFHENWAALPLSLMPTPNPPKGENSKQADSSSGVAKEFKPIILSGSLKKE